MTLIEIAIILVIIGVIMWTINSFIPMGAGMKGLLNIVVFVVVIIWLLRSFGVISNIPGVHIPPLR